MAAISTCDPKWQEARPLARHSNPRPQRGDREIAAFLRGPTTCTERRSVFGAGLGLANAVETFDASGAVVQPDLTWGRRQFMRRLLSYLEHFA